MLHNPLTGRHAPGYRFRLNCRAISRTPLYLPITMISHPMIVRLKRGESPLEVFDVSNIRDARKEFHQLRERYDFTFWAARSYFVRDIKDADNLVPLLLSSDMAYIIDILESRYQKEMYGRYVITKKGPPCGLTTTLQAYVLWRQIYSSFKGNANICGPSHSNLTPLKENMARFLGMGGVPSRNRMYLPPFDGSVWGSVIFSSVKNPFAARGIDLNYALFTDMLKWKDRNRYNSTWAISTALGSVLLDHRTLVIMEGNLPADFPDRWDDMPAYYDDKVTYADQPAPYIVSEAAYSSLVRNDTLNIHIKLN